MLLLLGVGGGVQGGPLSLGGTAVQWLVSITTVLEPPGRGLRGERLGQCVCVGGGGRDLEGLDGDLGKRWLCREGVRNRVGESLEGGKTGRSSGHSGVGGG